jgi:hypothetical protein
MTITVVQLSAPFQGGLTGQIMGLDAATATALIDASGASLYDMGGGAGVQVLPAGGYQGQWAGERTATFLRRLPGGVPNRPILCARTRLPRPSSRAGSCKPPSSRTDTRGPLVRSAALLF